MVALLARNVAVLLAPPRRASPVLLDLDASYAAADLAGQVLDLNPVTGAYKAWINDPPSADVVGRYRSGVPLAERSFAELLAFARASAATDTYGGLVVSQPADAVRQAAAGWLLEGQATNLLTNSEDLSSGSGWTSSSTMVPNNWTAPNGTPTADGVNYAVVSQIYRGAVSVTPGTTYCWSYWVWLAGKPQNYISVYNEQAGTFILAKTQTITQQGQWVRVWRSFTVPAGCTSVRLYADRADSAPDYGQAYYWGFQLEIGSIPTAYIPTAGAAATRAAEQLTLTPAAFAALFGTGAPQGFVVAEVSMDAQATGLARTLVQLDDGTPNNRLQLRTSLAGALVIAEPAVGGVSAAGAQSLGAPPYGSAFRAGMRWGGGTLSVCLGGAAPVSVAQALPVLSTLRLGVSTSSTQALNGRVRRVLAGRAALSDAAFQQLCMGG